MTKYPKIETAFERDDQFRVNVARLRRPVFASICRWVVTEKVDGTNMRLIFHRAAATETSFEIRGKTDNASIPPALLAHCTDLAHRVQPRVDEIMAEHGLTTYVLYGEGYGPKIQNGGRYRGDQGFILFDIAVGGGTYLPDAAVTDAAKDLDIPRVPVLGEFHFDDIIELVKRGFPSAAANVYDRDFFAEGIVARTVDPLYDNRGERLILKLKTKDFRGGRR